MVGAILGLLVVAGVVVGVGLTGWVIARRAVGDRRAVAGAGGAMTALAAGVVGLLARTDDYYDDGRRVWDLHEGWFRVTTVVAVALLAFGAAFLLWAAAGRRSRGVVAIGAAALVLIPANLMILLGWLGGH